MFTPPVSVIIPTYNRSLFLQKTMEGILNQTYPSYEVIVVDQTAHHPREVELYLRSIQNKIHYLTLEKPSVTRAKNLALAKASGEIVICIDDDVDLPQDFIERHVQNYLDPQVGAVAGRILEIKSPKSPPPKIGKITWYGQIFSNFYGQKRTYVEHGRGANISFYRESMIRCGGFDENFTKSAVREETDFCIRYLKIDRRLMIFDPETTLFHHEAPSGGCRISSRGLESLSYTHELYFWLKHFSKWLLPYFIGNLFVRFVLLDHTSKKMDAWSLMGKKLKAFLQGTYQGIVLYQNPSKPNTPPHGSLL